MVTHVLYIILYVHGYLSGTAFTQHVYMILYCICCTCCQSGSPVKVQCGFMVASFGSFSEVDMVRYVKIFHAVARGWGVGGCTHPTLGGGPHTQTFTLEYTGLVENIPLE